MKCPCCGGDSDREFIILHNTIYKKDGTKFKSTPMPMKYLSILLEGKPIIRTNRIGEGYSLDTHMARVRIALKEAGLPYHLMFTDDRWTLKVNRS